MTHPSVHAYIQTPHVHVNTRLWALFLLLIGGSQVGNLGLKEEEALFPKTSQRLGSCEYLYLFPELPLVTISLHF